MTHSMANSRQIDTTFDDMLQIYIRYNLILIQVKQNIVSHNHLLINSVCVNRQQRADGWDPTFNRLIDLQLRCFLIVA